MLIANKYDRLLILLLVVIMCKRDKRDKRDNINPVVITFGLLYIFELLLAEGLALSTIIVKTIVMTVFVVIVTLGLYFE